MPDQAERFEYYKAIERDPTKDKTREQLETMIQGLTKQIEILKRELKSKEIMFDIRTRELRATRGIVKAIENILTVFRLENGERG